jgi:hypothetical protein
MKVWLLGFLCLFVAGCKTPQPVYDNLGMIKENIVIQKRVATMLLNSVKPQNDKQVEALALKTMDVEQRFDRMASAHNRLVTYFGADQQVGYIVNIINFMQESSLINLLGQAEGESINDTLCKNLIINYNSLLSDGGLPSTPKNVR